MFIFVFLVAAKADLVAGDGDAANRAVCDAALANSTCLANSHSGIAAPLSGQLQKLSVIEVGKFGTQGSKHGRCGDARPPTQSNQPRAHGRNERPAHKVRKWTGDHPSTWDNMSVPQRPRVLAHTSDTMTVPRLVADVTPGPDDCPDCHASQHLGQHVGPPAPCQAEELSAPGQQHGNPEMSHGTVA